MPITLKTKFSFQFYEQITKKIQNDELVILPTETVYGLAGNGLSLNAIKSIYKIKNRPLKKKLILHCSSLKMVEKYFELNKDNLIIAKKYWPGPLTLILKKKNKSIPHILTQRGYCAVRIPQNKFLLNVIKKINKPLVMPSANKFKQLSPVNAKMAHQNFKTSDLTIIDGGKCKVGIESTMLKILNQKIEVIRYGLIDVFDVLKELPHFKIKQTINEYFPGTSNKHYSPIKPLYTNQKLVKKGSAFIGFGNAKKNEFKNLSLKKNLKEAASRLYYYFYLVDNNSLFRSISVAAIPNEGIGQAINDRLKRASKK